MSEYRDVTRQWMPYRIAARQYLGISEDVLLAAIKAGDLPAYEKPLTRGRKTTNVLEQRHSYFVNLADVDAWIRARWAPAFATE